MLSGFNLELTPFLFSGTAAMRNTKRGSWYIEALTSVFAEDSHNTHVADMLVKVREAPFFPSFIYAWFLQCLMLLDGLGAMLHAKQIFILEVSNSL